MSVVSIRYRWPHALLVVLAFLLLAPVGCKRSAPDAEQRGSFGLSDDLPVGEFQQEELRRETLALARAALTGRRGGEDSLAARMPGRRVFLTAYASPRRPEVGTGVGANLAESIRAAAADLSERARMDYSSLEAGDLHLRLDVVTKLRRKQSFGEEPIIKPNRREIGLFGFWIDTETTSCFVTPAEIIEREMYLEREKGLIVHRPSGSRIRNKPTIFGTMAARDPGCADLVPDTPHLWFWTTAWADTPDLDGSVELYRSHPLHEEPNRENLLRAIVMAGDYMTSAIRPNGRFNYLYHSEEDRDSNSYNLLRHGGSLYSLLQIYERTGYAPYLAAAERGFNYLIENSTEEQVSGYWGDSILYPWEGNKIKLGGAGLGLMGMAQYTETTGDTRYMEYMRKYAQFILFLTDQETGNPRSYYAIPPRFIDPGDVSIYYPGEALLGLMRLYYVDPDPRWLKGARDIANFLIHNRDAGIQELRLPHDHWLLIGLSYLYLAEPDPTHLEHILKITRAIDHKHRDLYNEDVTNFPDYLGTYYNPPRATPCSTRLEGLVAAMDVMLIANLPTEYERLRVLAENTARYILINQFRPNNTYHLPNPQKAMGGVRSGMYFQDLRNDYTQHAASGWVGLERHLALEQDGIVLPGGPVWSQTRRDGGAPFTGVPRAQVFPVGEDPSAHHIGWEAGQPEGTDGTAP